MSGGERHTRSQKKGRGKKRCLLLLGCRSADRRGKGEIILEKTRGRKRKGGGVPEGRDQGGGKSFAGKVTRGGIKGKKKGDVSNKESWNLHQREGRKVNEEGI